MKYVFVCGMPRSGTTAIAREIGRMKDCTGFENTGATMDEGQYLQDVYPQDTNYGEAGRFGFAPEMHLTEKSPLLTPANVARLRESWEKYWDPANTIRIEKTPMNLIKTRFLQAAFPHSYFIVIKRHPIPVTLATHKMMRDPIHTLFAHWLRCHEIYNEDKTHLENLYELSYEKYLQDPKKVLAEVASFIGTEFNGSIKADGMEAYNRKYFERWAYLLERSRFKVYYRSLAREYEPKFREYGWTLAPQGSDASASLVEGKPLPFPVADALNSGVDVFFFLWRTYRRSRNQMTGRN